MRLNSYWTGSHAKRAVSSASSSFCARMNDQCGLTPRAMNRRTCLVAINTSDATHNTTSTIRRNVAVGMEIPMPVARATYAATHAGHLGSSASVALGTIQPADLAASAPSQRGPTTVVAASRLDLAAVASVHECASAADPGDAVAGQ